MKKTQQLAALLLVVVLVLSACGTASQPQESTGPSPASTPATSEPFVVYSLYYDALIEKIVKSGFGSKAKYEVGVSELVSEQDAIRILSTELLSGGGPDVIVMDGLPMDNYISQGALDKLDEVVPDTIFPHIRAAYQQEDGSVYAMPVKFKIPLLLGANIEKVSTLTEIADWLEPHDYPWLNFSGPTYLEELYQIFGNRWMDGDVLQEEAFRQDVEAIAKMVELGARIGIDLADEGSGKTLSSSVSPHTINGDILGNGHTWHIGFCAGTLGNYGCFAMIGFTFEALDYNKEGMIKPVGEETFIPISTLAINSRSQKKEQAMNFVKFCLTTDIQMMDTAVDQLIFDENWGYAVNELYFQSHMTYDYNMPTSEVGLSSQPDHPVQWDVEYFMHSATYEQKQSIYEVAKTLTKPAPSNFALRDIFLGEARSYIEGSKTMDEAISSLKTKLPLYLAE